MLPSSKLDCDFQLHYLEEGAPESSSTCSFTGTRGEPACGGEGGGWSGGSVSQGCDPHGLHSWFIHFHPKLNFSATLPALTHRHLHATRSYFSRQPIHPAEPCFCLRAPSRSLFPDPLGQHLETISALAPPPPPSAPGWRPLSKPVHASWPKPRKWLQAKTPQDGPERSRHHPTLGNWRSFPRAPLPGTHRVSTSFCVTSWRSRRDLELSSFPGKGCGAGELGGREWGSPRLEPSRPAPAPTPSAARPGGAGLPLPAPSWYLEGNPPRNIVNCLNQKSSRPLELSVRNTIPRAQDKGKGRSFSA